MSGSNEQEQGATPSGSGCQPTASAAIASSQSGIPSAARPISGALLDQLQDELREMAIELRSEARSNLIEDDDIRANRDLAELLEYIANNRPLLVRFGFTLRKHHPRHAAIRELTGGAA